MEHAWLMNGKALNAALAYRRNHLEATWDVAREYAFNAFGLIDGVPGRSYDYLRFNLLANIALLFEMKGEFEVALEVFEQTFGSARSEEMKDDPVGAHFCYRVALLKSKLGQFDEADRWLESRAGQCARPGMPFQ
ncbi:hypothetical protein GL267_009295 [Acidithiobacillus ferrianus]|uniref:Tetratricopeptide repeat protein n=2 Tax=Acidithiobacillus ferrianus TaxID=2678518 RepID=A0A845UE75_9PROT|nr:hypothetical protein [Acidithiobacillus ferrianus]MDA8119018.1 hypothetical protein [Gammaproteobacteria bacterium]NDU42184.1 hypothetical protein [Acidithiobacillus ferrianus]